MDRMWSSFENIQREILGSAASSSRTAYKSVDVPHLKQINDSLYEVYTPEGRPAVDIIFFHGFQLQKSQDWHISTWLSGYGTEIWLNWIPAEIPGARILTVSYDSHFMRTTESDGLETMESDAYITGENILSDLLEANIGQSGCPVVLVGHSFGGLIIKQVCVQADSQLKSTLNASRKLEAVMNFLTNLQGFFFYACPHYGSNLDNFIRWFSKGALSGPVTIFNKEAARLNEIFRLLRKKYAWSSFGIGESVEGEYKGLIVEEASARLDVDGFYLVGADHFTVCQPFSRSDMRFIQLLVFVNGLLKEDEAEHSPKADFLNEFIGLEGQTMAVIEKVHENQRLCLVGVQGIGKTTLVEAVYNKIKDKFDYTCFFGEARNYLALEEHPDDLRTKIKRNLRLGGPVRQGRNVSNNFKWSTLEGKKVLIVLDDVVSESQVSLMTEADNFSDDSRIIVTTREREFLVAKNINFHFVEKLDHEYSVRLFYLHAFQMANVPNEYVGYIGLINEIVERCGGSPQTLKVVGRYFYTIRKVGFECHKEIGKQEMLLDLGRAIIGSEGSIGHPHLEGVSTQTQDIYHSVRPASPYDQVPQDAENGMARSREDIEKQTQQDQEGAQEESKEPTIMDEDHDSTANKAIFVAEEDAKTLDVIDEDNESNSSAGTPRNHVGHGEQHEVVKDFIRNFNRGKSGYVVSKAWLFRLEEHYKETVISVLRRAGFVEFYQTRTTIIYRRIENSASHVEASDFLDSEMSTVTSFENKFQLDIVQSANSSRLGSPWSLLDKRKTALTSYNEKVESFKTALKDTGPHGYFVSTQWLSTLSDHEVGDLNVALSNAGYSQLGKTSTATYFKRHRVYNNPGSQSETPSTSVRTILCDQGRPSTFQGTEFSLPAKLQDFNMDDTNVTSKIQERQRRRVDCECVPQHLTVSCTQSFRSPVEASTSSSQGFSKHVTRQRVGDCHVTMPKKLAQRIMNTRVDKTIELKTIDFDDMEKSYLKMYLLNVSAETSLSCCLTSDENDKMARFEFLKIQGAVKMEESMKLETGLVLRALRTNVVAYITKAEQSEGSEHMPLRPWVGELERLQSVDNKGQTQRPVYLEISGKDPKDSDPGSTTLELQCLEAYCSDFDPNHELLFSNYGPRVVFEGDLHTDHDQNLCVRYCDSLPRDDNFVGVDRKIKNVDFDCILKFSCRVT